MMVDKLSSSTIGVMHKFALVAQSARHWTLETSRANLGSSLARGRSGHGDTFFCPFRIMPTWQQLHCVIGVYMNPKIHCIRWHSVENDFIDCLDLLAIPWHSRGAAQTPGHSFWPELELYATDRAATSCRVCARAFAGLSVDEYLIDRPVEVIK
ncbi:hypothetical protein [Massilia sp. KIM]|uniref:hypothetical protein n=1 Tax=Massilia sp. KIM TaxID=1955422 RepID=UPI00098FF8C2|nr:hypothetical protein [Massilia sp. KIM]